MKAMLLAAGRGERLLPLTNSVPKPLLPVLGRPLAPQVLSRMAAQGIEEAVINLHHLPDPLRSALGDGSLLGLRTLHYSIEEGELLGTGGGLVHAAAQLRGSGTILVRNSDFLADIPLARALASHIRSGCEATLVVVPHRPGYTPVFLDERGRIREFGGRASKSTTVPGAYLFTGYHLIEESVLDRLPPMGVSDIVAAVYKPLAAEGGLNAHVHYGFWWEFGEPHEYLAGTAQLIDLAIDRRTRLGDFDPVRPMGDALVATGAGVDLHGSNISLTGRLAVGLGTLIGEGASLENSVVMPEAWIGPGSRLKHCIVGAGTEIPAGFEADDSVVAVDTDPAGDPPPGTTRLGNVLVRRFGTQ
jgi:NDP-sugar pyrophosphorylase family protein